MPQISLKFVPVWFAFAQLAFLATAVAQEDLSRSVTINTLGYYKAADGTSGGVMTPVKINLNPNPTGRIRLGFFEDEIDGYGEMWRAAAWVSHAIALDISGADSTQIQIEFERSGRVDGPSAGGLTTIGILAAIRGDSVRQDAAMTGTINPDGTIGPVGGIPHKIDGAADADMKLVLIPLGQRQDRDENLERDVDLFERGQSRGLEVKAVGDIYTAYELLTGSPLPRPGPAADPQLQPEVYAQVQLKVDEWLLRFKNFQTEYKRIPSSYRSEYCESLMSEAQASSQRIDSLLTEGQAPLAMRDAMEAAVSAGIATAVSNTIWVDAARGRESAKDYVRKFAQIHEKTRIAVDRLKQYKPKTLGEAGVLIYGFSALTESLAYQAAAEAILAGRIHVPIEDSELDPDEEDMLMAAYAMQIAALDCEHVRDLLDIAGDLEGPPMVGTDRIIEVAVFLRRAAEANLNQFEQVVVANRAKSENATFASSQFSLMQRDETYMTARVGIDVATPTLRKFVEDTDSWPYAELGAAINTYELSSLLMATHYSLGVIHDKYGDIERVGREGALQFVLDFATDQARRNIQLLQDNGVDPGAAVFSWKIASILRGRQLLDRFEALRWLWEANTQSRVLAHLGGFSAKLEKP
ncbi:MAG: hypothetical protein KDA57_14960 [Planctomycetales bacterium]|nr:hypothetical protein [Planctomycetales bacterium]